MGHLALSNAETLHLVGSLVLLLACAHLVGALARRIGQPSVAGYLVAGLILGPSGVGAAWPWLATFLLPGHGTSHLLGAVVEFSLVFVLIVLGAETDVPLVRRLGRAAGGVVVGGVCLPLVAGSAVAYAFGPSLVVGHRLAGAVLVGGALGVSSLPVIARLVDELRIARRDVGQLALAAAAANDVYGLLLLALVGAAVGATGTASVVRPVVGLVVFVVLFALVGQRLVDFLLEKVRHHGPNPTGSVAVAAAVAFGAAAALQAIGVEAALGAFLAGVVIGRSRFRQGDTVVRLRSFSDAVFAPLFFASAGLLVDLRALASLHRIAMVAALLGVAVASKAIGTGIGARWAGLRPRENAALMTLLNGRGALQVIIATAGLRMGLLSDVAYTAVLVVSLASSLLVAPTLRRLVGNWEGSEDEQRRLAYEERIGSSLLVRQQRLLVPALPATDPGLAAALFDDAWPGAAELTVVSPSPDPDGIRIPDLDRPVRRRTGAGSDPIQAVLAEAQLGYGVLGVGVSATALGLPPLVSELLDRSPMPTVLIRPARGRERIDVPGDVAVATTGTTAGIAGEELAASLARRHDARLHVVHVVPNEVDPPPGRSGGVEVPDGVLDGAADRAGKVGLRPRVVREHAATVSRGLLRYVEAHGIDLLVVGARPRRVGGAPFLGYAVEELLGSPVCPALAVVVFPDAPPSDLDQPFIERQVP